MHVEEVSEELAVRVRAAAEDVVVVREAGDVVAEAEAAVVVVAVAAVEEDVVEEAKSHSIRFVTQFGISPQLRPLRGSTKAQHCAVISIVPSTICCNIDLQ